MGETTNQPFQLSHEGACQVPHFRGPKGPFPCTCRLYLRILRTRRGSQRSRSEPQALPLTAAGAGGIGSPGRQVPVPPSPADLVVSLACSRSVHLMDATSSSWSCVALYN